MLGADYIRVLYVDLTKEKVSVEERKDLFHLLGGTGVAAKLLEENMHPELPALHEDQPIVFAIGPLSTIFPVATKTVATFISPLTGEYGESHAGGRSAMAIRNAGYDAIVITGKATTPYITPWSVIAILSIPSSFVRLMRSFILFAPSKRLYSVWT